MFRKSPEKRADEEAMQAQVDRLKALSPEALALEIMPTLGSDELKKRITGVRVQDVCTATLGGFKSSLAVNTGVLLLPVKEALQRLEHANLIMQMANGIDQSTKWRITTTGEQALSDGSVAAKLGQPAS
ncbi:MAG TPA: hypothetical protein VHV79_06265 [Mycobacteriales bacterium]|jgi:hypothetical protein|nr:hypothetical protein [Mycobacteriales bacterium]